MKMTEKQKNCPHMEWYIWAEEGAEWGRCRACGYTKIHRILDKVPKGMYPEGGKNQDSSNQ